MIEHKENEFGFSLAEFLICSLVLLGISAAVFSLLGETQQAASYQTEVQAVLDNTRIALDTAERNLRQAANDPNGTGFPGITIISPTEVHLRTDVTGSALQDKGDPDGDTNDAGEDVTIRYNAATRSLEMVPNGASAQSIANYISAFSMQYFNAAGAVTAIGNDVRKVRISITGATTLPDPRTRQIFSVRQTSEVQIASRQ